MSDELIINLCPTGMVPTRAQTPHVPLTPAEVAADARRCADLGVSIIYVHPRDADGVPTQSAERAREFPSALASSTTPGSTTTERNTQPMRLWLSASSR